MSNSTLRRLYAQLVFYPTLGTGAGPGPGALLPLTGGRRGGRRPRDGSWRGSRDGWRDGGDRSAAATVGGC